LFLFFSVILLTLLGTFTFKLSLSVSTKHNDKHLSCSALGFNHVC